MTKQEIENFSEYCAYGAYITKDGERVPFNRRYAPLLDKERWVKDIARQEWYYQDTTPFDERLKNSGSGKVVYFVDYIKEENGYVT